MIWFLFACQAETETAPKSTGSELVETLPPTGGPHPLSGLPGGSPAEDLSDSWSEDLAVPVCGPGAEPGCSEGDGKDCPDGDGDGYPSALECPWAGADKADCDDGDPAVTPDTERWVAPGPFIMGSDSSHAGSDEDPVHVARLSGYCMDRDETGAAEWADWLQDEGRNAEGGDVRNMKDGKLEKGRENHPAEGATYSEASEFCEAKGKALPTEAQWEKAARGGCEGGDSPDACDKGDLRPYPWGTEEPTCSRANHQLSSSGMPTLCKSDTLPADALPDGEGPYGHRHLAGNVWEYVSDFWHPEIYGGTRVDPGGPAEGEMHVLRGGGWNTFSTNMRVANRFHDLVMGSATGFRCARPTVPPIPDDVEPLELVALSGTVDGSMLGSLTGRALYISAFDSADADSQGMLAPGRSPVSELKLVPGGSAEQSFRIKVPKGGSYILSAALDSGGGAGKEDYVSASGSGGFGHAEGNPISAEKETDGITISISPAPEPGKEMKGGPPGQDMNGGRRDGGQGPRLQRNGRPGGPGGPNGKGGPPPRPKRGGQ
jgi:formylglycine-generating enzyme